MTEWTGREDESLMPLPRALISWSSGKDAAWTLHALRTAGEMEVVGLLTAFNSAFDRVAMHATRRALVEAQMEAVGLPLFSVPLPWPCSNAEYEEAMETALNVAKQAFGITHIAFGDLFLADIRRYREEQMQRMGLAPLFPLWDIPTDRLARQMLDAGLRAYLTCVDPRHLPASFAGRAFDAALLADLPSGVDPCGENGEFHTFACDGPMFSQPVAATVGEVVTRDGFVFADLFPAS
jgi:uncharacterized protein (TIGR00290 family)